MAFESDYWHTLDNPVAKKLNLDPGTLGISTPPFKDQVESLRTRIFQGASRIELGFTGSGKGNLAQGSTTQEQYGKEERESIRHLAKLNEVQLSTHATFGIGGLSGFSSEEKGFSKTAAEHSLNEVKRAIDFAADTAGGGPIVLHTQEFPRPISNVKPEGVKGRFEGFPGEETEGMIYFADKRTGEISAIKKDVIIPKPKLINKDNPDEGYVRDAEGKIEFEKKKFWEYIEEEKNILRKKNPGFDENYIQKESELNVLKEFEKRQIERLEGERERFDTGVRDFEKELRSLNNLKENYNKVLNESQDKEAVRAMLRQRIRSDPNLARGLNLHIPEEEEKFIREPEKFLDEAIKDKKSTEKYYREAVISYGRELETAKERQSTLRPIEEVGLNRSAETIARAAIFAYDKEKLKKLERPLFVAPENLFDTSYGSDPRELRKVIETSREKMAEKLVEDTARHLSKEQAKKIAEEHIKATFDIGHLNTWRKYFTGNDEEFKKWVLKEVEDLQKREIIGHVHLSDNFGYYDEHVSPGFGNAPVAEFVKKLKEFGYKGTMLVEPGHQDARAWTEAMRNLHSPIYRSKSWTDIESGYFGKNYVPGYAVGSYAPDISLGDEHRDFKFWSGVSIE